MLLVDYQIRGLCTTIDDPYPLIEPFSEAVSGGGLISHGLTSAGYDLRLANEILIFKNTYGEEIDPKRFKDEAYKNRMFDKLMIGDNQPVIIPAHSYILGMSYEYLRIPKHLKGRVVGKSTYARCGIICNLTPLEPEWEGNLTLEISNATPLPAKVYVMEGIAQIEFELLSGIVETTYARKNGQYQRQTEVTPARVK